MRIFLIKSLIMQLIYCSLWLYILSFSTLRAAEKTILLDDFNAPSKAHWKLTASHDRTVEARFGVKLPLATANRGMILQLPKNPKNKRPVKNSWFQMTRLFSPQENWANSSGIRLKLGTEKACKWWLKLAISCGGDSFSHVLLPGNYSGKRIEDRVVLWDSFKNSKGKRPDPAALTSVQITGAAVDITLCLGELSLIPKRNVTHPVSFKTNKPSNNIFQPGQTIEVSLTPLKGTPKQVASLEVEIIDYFGSIIYKNRQALPKNGPLKVRFNPGAPGYYDVKVYWCDKKGKRLSAESCIATTGSLEQGRGTFAVMPSSLKTNADRSRKLGSRAYFGFHGTKELADLMGATWLVNGGRWIWDEKNSKPDQVNGVTRWLAEKIAKEAPKSTAHQAITNMSLNHLKQIPEWARAADENKAPGVKDITELERYVADVIRLQKHRYPHMKQRIYDPLWELNLNQPKMAIHKPVYYPEDILDMYRRVRKVVDAVDPGAILAGPNVNSYRTDLEWHLPLFKGGLLKTIDALNLHGYHTPPPERDMVAERFRELKGYLKQYGKGKKIDIYCTELGYRSLYGSEDKHKPHAQWHARVAVILKGEGLTVYYPFYTYDYTNRDRSWGICYNLDPKLSFGTKEISPKAALPALAACINELEGTEPVGRLEDFGRDIWCYVFRELDGGEPVVAIWSVENEQELSFPAGDVKNLTVADIMGRRSTRPVKNGLINLKITPDIQYLRSVDPAIYNHVKEGKKNLLTKLYPGETRTFPGVKTDGMLKAWGKAKVSASQNGLTVQIPVNAHPGMIPVRLTSKTVRWLAIREPMEIIQAGMKKTDKDLKLSLILKNRGIVELPTTVSLRVPGRQTALVTKMLAATTEETLHFTLPLELAKDPGRPLKSVFVVRAGNLPALELHKKFSFLAAHRKGEDSQGKLSNTISWQGKGASGAIDRATAHFTWDSKALFVTVEVKDDVFHQTKTKGAIWMEDSLQIAFDTHPEKQEVYAPLAGIYTKKISDLDVALTPKELTAWRHKTHNEEELPTGNMTGKIDLKVNRLEKAKKTIYQLTIPWQEIGLSAEEVKAGKSLGISLLVNDHDGKGTRRVGLELFGGIMRGRDFRKFGLITLF